MVGYIVTDPAAQKKGLAREAYMSAIIGAAQEAERQGKKLTFAAGECTWTSEKFWNSIGWKRVYTAAALGKTKSYEELRYVQPALEFNFKTGKPAKGSEEVAEHLMIDALGQKLPTKEKIMETVRAFYKWCNLWPADTFKTKKAHQEHVKYIKSFENQLEKQLNSGGQLIFLDQENRLKAIAQGVGIKEYVEADHAETGDEDF